MRIVDRCKPLEGHAEHACQLVKPDCAPVARTYALQAEHVVHVYLDGTPAMSLTCTPSHIAQLVLGRLFTEGVIQSADDVDELQLCDHSTRVMVALRNNRSPQPHGPLVQDVGTCSTSIRALSNLIDAFGQLPQLEPYAWEAADVFALATLFESDSPMHRRTYGAHSCYLARGSEVLYCCEDLGRHNAFDKVVGCALVDGVDLGRCTVFTSGRVPTDMAAKAIRAGIPIMVSKAVPTDLAVQMAREHGLTLICSAHSDSFRVLNDAAPCGMSAGEGPSAG